MENVVTVLNSIISEAKLSTYFSNINFDDITKIHITICNKNNDWLGKVIPKSSNDKLTFELFIHQSIINDLQTAKDDKYNFAKSVIFHELYHINEMLITNKIIDIVALHDIKRDCTKSLLTNLGYLQWSEYYAHHNSSKHFKPSIHIAKHIEQAEVSLTILKETAEKENIATMFEFMYNNIEKFISSSVILAANYNCSHDSSYLKIIRRYEYSNLYAPFYNHINEIINYMDSLYNSYPEWINENVFLEVGEKLFSIIHSFNMTYSTNDLSDNFIFKLKE